MAGGGRRRRGAEEKTNHVGRQDDVDLDEEALAEVERLNGESHARSTARGSRQSICKRSAPPARASTYANGVDPDNLFVVVVADERQALEELGRGRHTGQQMDLL